MFILIVDLSLSVGKQQGCLVRADSRRGLEPASLQSGSLTIRTLFYATLFLTVLRVGILRLTLSVPT